MDKLDETLVVLRMFVVALEYDDSSCCWGCGVSERYKAREKHRRLSDQEFEAKLAEETGGRGFPPHDADCPMEAGRRLLGMEQHPQSSKDGEKP